MASLPTPAGDVNIKIKMGTIQKLPELSINPGTIYFTRNEQNQFGELYFDDVFLEERIKIGGTNLSSSTFDNNGTLTLVFEDGTTKTATIPAAASDKYGILTTGTQAIAGNKTFSGNVSIKKLTITGTDTPQIVFSRTTHNYMLVPTDADLCICSGSSASLEGSGLVIKSTGIFPGKKNTFDIGSSTLPWNNIYVNNVITSAIDAGTVDAGTVTATSMTATTFTGALTGNAASASKLLTAVGINGTNFDGSTGITTAIWGTARKMKISNTANTSTAGIDVNGGADITLTIPSTMTGFTSISSTTLLGTNLGSTTSLWTNLYVTNPYIYSANSKYHKLSSTASAANYTLTLPNATGTLTYITTAVGDANSPVYVTAGGLVSACTTIAIDHGGTGASSMTSGALLVGGSTKIQEVANTTAGKILVSTGASNVPKYDTPTLTWTGGTSTGPTLTFAINGGSYQSAAIPSASSSASGIVTNGAQTFAGAKTFSGAIKGSSSLEIVGTSKLTGTVTAGTMVVSGQIKSSTNTSYSYMQLADTKLTLSSASLFLNGTKIVLNSGTGVYGTSLPTSGNEEGRVFFLLT